MDRTGLDETKYTILEHLGELRARLVWSLAGVLATGLGCLAISPWLLDVATEPLRDVLAEQNRVDVALVALPEEAATLAIEAQLEGAASVRYRGRFADLRSAAELVAEASTSRRPLDLVLAPASAWLADDLETWNLLDGVTRVPSMAFMVEDAKDPLVAELRLEGASVIKTAPRAAALSRVVRQAAAAAGKTVQANKLVVLSPLEIFFSYLYIAIVCGLFLGCPIWIYQAWAFIAPGLYAHERAFALPVVLSGSALFIAGGLFAYFAMFPVMFDFLVNQMMPDSVASSFTVDNYLGLLLRITVAFGVVFELPLAIAMLASVGLVDAPKLRKARKYAIVIAAVLGAVLTPADPISQLMMTIPLILFYEVGILLAAIFARPQPDTEG